jgi:hypothetical protein
VKPHEIEEQALDALRTCLKDIPFLKITEARREVQQTGPALDQLVTLDLNGQEMLLLVEVRSNGQPRQVRDAANQILRNKTALPQAYGVFVAPYVSPRAAEVCREAEIGYLDLAGNCRLSFGTVFVERRGHPNAFSQKRLLRSLYSPKATRVLRLLLERPDRIWKLQDLARSAKVSIGQAHNVKELLADHEWLRAEAGGLRLSQPAALLDEWAENYDVRRSPAREYYSPLPIGEIEASVAEACRQEGLRYALAGFSAAERLAPFVRYQRAAAYLERDVDAIAAKLSFKEVASGANVTLLTPYDEGVWHGVLDVDGLCVTSAIQTYLDLRSMRARGEEAAEFLRKQEIEKQW